MARTRLFGLLRRSAARAFIASRLGPEAAERAGCSAHQLSRRRFLELSAAAAASAPVLAACGGDEATPRPGSNARVGVVGAGIAGLHAAYRLMKAGVNVRVFEGQGRVGGRMFTARGMFPDGQVAELGGERIDTGHEVMHQLAGELEIELDDLFAGEPADLRRDTFHFRGGVLEESRLVELFRPVAARMARVVAAAEADDAEFARLDAQNIVEWLDGEGMADPLLREVLRIAYVGEHGLEADQQSAFNLLYLIDWEEPDPFRIFGDSDERFHTRGGSDTFTTRLAQRLGDRIELGHTLAKVKAEGDGRVTLTFERGAGGVHEETFDHVVLALPFTKLREVDLDEAGFSAEKLEVIEGLGYGANAKLIGSFASRVWREQHRASGSAFTDTGVQTLWDSSRAQAGDSGLLTVFLGGRAGEDSLVGTPEDRMIAALPAVEQVFPGVTAAYRSGSAVRMHWPSMPWALGSYTCYRPGQWAFHGLEGVREGQVHFAGEHTSHDFQRSMEGAAETGALVALEILEDLGITSQAARLRQALGARSALPQATYRGLGAPRLRRLARRRWGRAILHATTSAHCRYTS